jgi:hypothetical protein
LALNDKLRSLRMRQEELTAAIEDQHCAPTPAALADIRAMLSEGLDDDAPIPRQTAVCISSSRRSGSKARKRLPTFKLPTDSLRDQTVRPPF